MVLHKYIVDTGDAKQSCTGPQELQEWLASGRIKATARVCDLATGTWHEAGSLIQRVRARTDTQRCADIENTLCKLKQAAELLVETLKGDRSREELRAAGSDSGTACDDDDIDTNDAVESAGVAV